MGLFSRVLGFVDKSVYERRISNFSVRRYHAQGKRTGIDKTMAQIEDASNSMTDFASFLEGKSYFKVILKHLHDDCRFTVHNRGQIGVY